MLYEVITRPNIDGLGLDAVGVRVNAKTGAIEVSPDSRSSVDSIYAVGDVTDRAALTPVAIAEGRAFAESRITSYNVCYTKLLRSVSPANTRGEMSGMPARCVQSKAQGYAAMPWDCASAPQG